MKYAIVLPYGSGKTTLSKKYKNLTILIIINRNTTRGFKGIMY